MPPRMEHAQTRFVDATRIACRNGKREEAQRESRDDDGIIFAKPTNGTTDARARRHRKTLETYSSLSSIPSRIRARHSDLGLDSFLDDWRALY